ncbi:RodZ domain-containing protein [Pontibacter sp. JAM-7]|uniref:RodZ domain-containing protein n=1 Tax=Pontibacter sp. JAM-7 TaxID=3366581 RepID=UPI003AF6E6DB
MSSEEQAGQDGLTSVCWGETLKTAREAREMPQSQVAAQLNLPVNYIHILENSSVVGLPSLVFARGYIRAYARLVKLDDNALIIEFDKSFPGNGASQAGQVKSVSRIRQQAKVNDPLMKLFTWLFVLGIILLTFWWWQTQSGSTVTGVEPDQAVQPVADAPVVNQDGTLVLPKLDETDTDTAGSGINDIETASAAVSEPEPVYLSDDELTALQNDLDQNASTQDEAQSLVSAEDSVAPAEMVETGLVIEFAADCWVSVRNQTTGQRLVGDTRRSGQTLTLDTGAPLKIILGAADAVSAVRYNGEDIELAAYSSNNVVRLSLPLSE